MAKDNMSFYRIIFLSIFCFAACKGNVNPPVKSDTVSKLLENIPIERLNLPDGFSIEVYADDVFNARSMSLGDDGTLYVGTRSGGFVYALKDTDGDYRVDKKWTLLDEGDMPNGVAYKDGDLYVAEVSRILKYEDIASKLDNPGKPEVVYDEYPTDKHHGWKYIAFGPDGRLYVPVGAPCNLCLSDNPVYASITSINPDGTDMRIEQEGVRNTVGFTWHPETDELWFTDNGRDMMGDDMPACELNRATKRGQHFGYPYCHQGDVQDPDFPQKKCSEFIPPAANLGAHTAPLGVEFMKSKKFPASYRDKIFMAEHGSWNRSKKIGYQISMVTEKDGQASEYKPFIDGWLDKSTDEAWGRPVDMEWMPDGSLLISDDFANVIYRVSYVGE